MPEDIVAHGYLMLSEEMPFGNLPIKFRMPDGKLYEVEASHNPVFKHEDGQAVIVEGQRMIEVKVKRIDG